MSTDYPPPGLRERLGYRGLVLVWFGSVFVFIGLSIIFDTVTPSPTLPHTLLPIWFRVSLWEVAAGVAIVAGIANIWTVKLQIPAFILLIIPPAERALSYSYSVFAEYQPILGEAWWHGIPGNRMAGACIYTLVTVGLLLIASWPEPAHRYTINSQKSIQKTGLLFIDEEALESLRLLEDKVFEHKEDTGDSDVR